MWERVPNLRPQESEGFNSISSAFDLRNIDSVSHATVIILRCWNKSFMKTGFRLCKVFKASRTNCLIE